MTLHETSPQKTTHSPVGSAVAHSEKVYIAEAIVFAIFLVPWWLWADSLVEHAVVAVGLVVAVFAVRRARNGIPAKKSESEI